MSDPKKEGGGSERVRFTVVTAAALSLLIAACTSAETDPVSASTVPSSATSASPDISTTSQSAQKTEVTVYEQVMVLGEGDGLDFNAPNHLALDADDNLYVTEFVGGRVFVFSPAGEFLHQFAGAGDGIGELSAPTGIAVDANGDIYVGESGSSRVQVFNSNGVSIATWGQLGSGPGEFRSAMGVGINAELGRVYVADFGNSRIHVYTLEGELLFMFPRDGDSTQIGDEPDQMSRPIGVDLAADGTVYVVDSGNSRVQKFTADGEIIEVLSSQPIRAPQVISVEDDGSYWLSGPSDSVVAYFDSAGDLLATLAPSEGGFNLPHGTETMADGAVWLADTGNGVVRKYRVAG
jgi:DNA-binding beta-propeller fold protein YncE